jgi:hypothetical protein
MVTGHLDSLDYVERSCESRHRQRDCESWVGKALNFDPGTRRRALRPLGLTSAIWRDGDREGKHSEAVQAGAALISGNEHPFAMVPAGCLHPCSSFRMFDKQIVERRRHRLSGHG